MSQRPPFDPNPEHSPFTPEGQIEQMGQFASGVKRLSPGKRIAVVAFVVLLFLAPVLIVVLAA